MLNKNILKVAALVLFTLTLTGCKKDKYSGEKSPGTGDEVGEVTWFVPENKGYSTMKAKASMSLSLVNMLNIKAVVNVEVGRQLMISIQPLLGIEMYRVTCNQDSIIFIDKMTRSYIAEPYKYFTDKNFNLNYEMIEGLLCNRYFDPLKENYKGLTIKEVDTDSVLHCQAPNYYVEFLVGSGNINRTLFSTNDGTEYVLADYNTFTQIGDYSFPMAAVCTLSSPKFSFSSNINFESVTFDTDVTIVSGVPSGYKKSSIENLINN